MITKQLKNGHYLLTKDSITSEDKDWQKKLEEISNTLENFGILSPVVLRDDGKIFWHGGSVLPNVLMPYAFAAGEPYYGQYPGTRETDILAFHCVIVHKDLYESIHIDEGIPEDIFECANYCLTALAKGYKMYATGDVVVSYKGEKATPEKAQQFAQSFQMSHGQFAHKWGATLRNRFTLPVCYHTGIGQPTGFAKAARGYIKGLTELGVKVQYKYMFGDPQVEARTGDEFIDDVVEDEPDMHTPQVVWAQAPFFFKNSGKYKIGHCEFEGTEWPKEWVPQCNMMNEIWVPTEWDRDKAIKAGVNVPIYVIYQGIDPDYFHPKMAPMQTEATESFKFIVNAAWLHRKNLPALIRAFASEFKKDEDVCLIVKTMNVGLVPDIKKELEKLNIGDNTPKVYVNEQGYADFEMPSFYTMGDCYLAPTHGEAWGLPIFEALACGVPVITTAFGAPNEVLRDENKDPIPGVIFTDYRLGVAQDNYEYLKGKLWAEPNMIQFAKQMRMVFENRKQYKEDALKGSDIVREKFNWLTVCQPIVKRLQDIYEHKMS